MHPLKQLRKILNTSTQQRGTVIKNIGDSLIVATPNGSKSIKLNATDKTIYKVGDVVVLNNNAVVGKRLNNPIIYVV